MRLEALKGKGIGAAFPGEFAIDFRAVPGPLVAVVGPNGAGKSTLLELFGGAMYRKCPTRGALTDLATCRDSYLEAEVVNGSRHRIRHALDAASRAGEAIVMDESGNSLTGSTLVSKFDAWAAKHLPPKEVFFASIFAAQKSEGFLGMKPAERKGCLLRVLGIEHYETLAKKAREHVQVARNEAKTLAARVADERARLVSPDQIEAEIATLVGRRKELEGVLAIANAEVDRVVAAEQIALAAQQDVSAHLARRNELQARVQIAAGKLADVEKRLANNANVLGRAEEIRAAKESAAKLEARLAELASEHAAAVPALTAAENEAAVAAAAVSSLTSRLATARARAQRAQARTVDKAAVESAVARVASLRGELEVLEGDVGRIETLIREGQDLVLHSATNRIGGLRSGLEILAADEECDRVFVARKTLTDDDEAASLAAEAPARVEADRRRLREKQAELAAKRAEVQQAERLAARQSEIAAAEAEAVEAGAEALDLDHQLADAQAAAAVRTEATAAARATVARLEGERSMLAAERERLQPLVKLAEPLMQAEARLAELQPQQASLRADVEALRTELAQLGETPAAVALPDVAGAKAKVEACAAEISRVDSSTAVKASELDRAREGARRLAALETELRAVETEVADWQKLADDLGRDGLQALEIDAAGPELTTLVNDLLHTCVGTRWTISIEVLDGCEVSVLDTEKGREGEASTLSGGEAVIVGEAVSLALSMLACRRSGVTEPTLVRDETGAALDPKNAKAYVAMLRRACEIVGASRCLFVSHVPEIQALADARLEVAGGQVRVAA